MKNKIKKILTTTIVSAVSATAIGCSSGNSKLAKNIDNGVSEFVSSINNLDYVETPAQSATNDKLGKIVETTAYPSNTNLSNYLSENISDSAIENTITKPSERTDNFKLYVLSESPYVSFTSDDNSASFNMYVKFSTNKIEETSDEIASKINSLILKRSILMIYVNEIYSGNVTITEENRTAINAYVNVIKENASFLKGNRGMVKNQLNLASDLLNNESNENLVNYYIIKSGEALETRSNKIDSTLSAITSIIGILENNLTPNSPYYNSKLSSSYESLLNNANSSTSQTISSENKQLADNIAESLNLKLETNNSLTQSHQDTNNTTKNNQETTNTSEQNNTGENNQDENTYNVKNLNINTPNSQNLEINNITNGATRNTLDTSLTNHPSYQNSSNNQQSLTTQNINSSSQNNQRQNSYTKDLNSEQNNLSHNTTSQTRTINNTQNTINRERNSSTTSKTRRSSRRNTRTQNHTITPQTTRANETNQNQAKSVNNMDNQNKKIMRADRTQETTQTEQFNTSKQTYTGHERAERVPYTTTTTFNQ